MKADTLRDEDSPGVAGTIESGMRTGQAGDDEPEMTIGDQMDAVDEKETTHDLAAAEAALGGDPVPEERAADPTAGAGVGDEDTEVG